MHKDVFQWRFLVITSLRLLYSVSGQTDLSSVNPCDGCLWQNGIGFAAGPDCWQYYQCTRVDNQVLPILRTTAFGTFWDNSMLSQREPGPGWNCPIDRCFGLPSGARYGRSDNCRIYMQCRADPFGIGTYFIDCCPDGMGFAEGQGCVLDPSCQDSCMEGPMDEEDCSLKPVPGSDLTFILGEAAMLCAEGTRFDEGQCTCVLDNRELSRMADLGRVCQPDLDLLFDSFGVRDVSRNRFPVTNNNVTTRDTGFGHVGVFENAQLIIDGFANRDMTDSFAISMKVRPIDFVHQNEVVVSNSGCQFAQETYALLVNSPFGFPQISGWAHTVPDTQTETGSALLPPDRFSEVVYEFDGTALTLFINDGLGPLELINTFVGPLMTLRQPSCAMMVGGGESFTHFRGEISEFKVFTCIRENFEAYFN